MGRMSLHVHVSVEMKMQDSGQCKNAQRWGMSISDSTYISYLTMASLPLSWNKQAEQWPEIGSREGVGCGPLCRNRDLHSNLLHNVMIIKTPWEIKSYKPSAWGNEHQNPINQ